MARKRDIRVRLSHQRLMALLVMCTEQLLLFKPADEHQVLLREHLEELRHQLQVMARKTQDNYTLCMKGSEAIAFYQLKAMLPESSTYGAIIIENMIDQLSLIAA